MDSHEYLLEEYKKCIKTIHNLNPHETNRCIFLWTKLIQSFKEKESNIRTTKHGSIKPPSKL